MLYDAYEVYREQALTPEEEARLKEAKARAATDDMDPAVKVYIQIALARAQGQFLADVVMPEDETVGIRFPGIDPMGKYSPIDMKFAQRQADTQATLATKGESMVDYHDYFAQRVERNPLVQEWKAQAQQTAMTHRLVSRAAKLCLDPQGSEQLQQRLRDLEAEPCVKNYETVLKGEALMAGVQMAPEQAQEVKDFYQTQLHMPLHQNRIAQTAKTWVAPQHLDIAFQDFDNKVIQNKFSNPRNWGKSMAELTSETASDLPTLTNQIQPYALSTVNRALSPFFEHMKEEPLSFAQTLIVNGLSVIERMERDGLDTSSPAAVQAKACHYVAQALMNDQRVEAFPMHRGEISAEPMTITKSGFQPSPLQPVKLNAWERYFNSHGGFYAEKAERAKEYQDTVDARKRILDMAPNVTQPPHPDTVEHHDLLRQQMQKTMPRIHVIEHMLSLEQVGVENVREQMFAPGELDHIGEQGAIRCVRNAPTHFCMGNLLTQGHSIRDILDPNQLQAEKRQAGEHYLHLVATDNQRQYIQEAVAGMTSLNQAMAREFPLLPLRNETEFLKGFPVARAMSNAAFDLAQETTRPQGIALATDAQEVHRQSDMAVTTGNTIQAINDGYIAESCLQMKSGRYDFAQLLAKDMGAAVLGREVRMNWSGEMKATGRIDTLHNEVVASISGTASQIPTVQSVCDQILDHPDALDVARLRIFQGEPEKAISLQGDFTKPLDAFLSDAKMELVKPQIVSKSMEDLQPTKPIRLAPQPMQSKPMTPRPKGR